MNVIAVVFTKRDACAAKHQQIVSVQHGWKDKSQSGGQPNGILTEREKKKPAPKSAICLALPKNTTAKGADLWDLERRAWRKSLSPLSVLSQKGVKDKADECNISI